MFKSITNFLIIFFIFQRLNPKKAGSFDPISQAGGGDLGRGATKYFVIWHVRKPCQDESRKISILKIEAVFKLCKFMLSL